MTDIRKTLVGVVGEPGNGLFIRLTLDLESDIILACRPEANGCLWAIAIAEACAKLATHRPIEKALLIEPRDLELQVGGLPDGKGHYAEMAISALRAALCRTEDR